MKSIFRTDTEIDRLKAEHKKLLSDFAKLQGQLMRKRAEFDTVIRWLELLTGGIYHGTLDGFPEFARRKELGKNIIKFKR